MSEHIPLIPLVYLLVAVPYAVMGLYAWRRRPAVAVTPFAWMMVAIAAWSLLYALEILSPSPSTKITLAKIEYIAIVPVPVLMLLFALEYSGQRQALTPRRRALLWVVPLATLTAALTNDLHGWMWDSERLEVSFGLTLLAVRSGPLFWFFVAYSYLLLLLGTLLLIIELIQQSSIYRFQISFVIAGLLFPWIGSLFYVFGIGPIHNLDLTPVFFIPSALALGWAIMRYRLLDVMPLEHVTILQNIHDGVIVTDSKHRILYLNPIAESLLSLSPTNALGQPLSRVCAAHGKTLRSHLSGEAHRFEMTFSGSAHDSILEGSVSPLHLRTRTGASHGPPGHVLILHDITARKETENLLSRREAIMEAISLAAEQFLKESAWEHTIPAVLEKMGQAVDVSRVYVFVNYTDNQGVIHSSQCYEWAAPGITPQINNPELQHVPLRGAGFGRWEETLGQGRPICGLVRDFPESEQSILSSQQIVSIAVIPIFVEDHWWGFIGLDECRYEREWTTSELKALHIAANIFGSAETRARTEQKLLRRQRTLNLMHDIVLTSLQASDLSAMANTLVEHVGKLINADGCFLSLWDDEHQQTIPLAAYGPYKEKYPDLQVNPGEKTFTSSAIKMGRTLVVEDVSTSPYVSRRITAQFSARSVIVCPMIAGANRLGTIILSFDQPHRFQTEEIAICEQATSLIALALEKFQAVEHAHRRAEKSETLRKASAAVTETLQAEEAIARILEQLFQVIPHDSASVQLLDGNELEIVGGHGWANPADVIGMRFPIPADNPNTVVIQTGKPYVLPEADKVYPIFLNPPHNSIRSWLGVPLVVRGRTIGLLAIDSSQPNYFKTENIALVSAFADQVAIVLENVRQFKETQTQAITDALTGIYNRRGLFDMGEFEFARARRLNRPFSAAMIDVDHFKRVNDNYGHSIGDQVLGTIAKRCRSVSRKMDLVGRYGGEEFLILMPESNQDAAQIVAERLRYALNVRPISTTAGPIRITISAGVAETNETDTLQTLIERADDALYAAKSQGRNRVACAH